MFDINGTIKFFNILSGSEIIGRFAPTPVDLYLSNTTNPTFYASYTYKPSGQIENENLNDGQRAVNYSYNVKGYPTTINSTLFTETLTYETDGYGGVGYYHGNIASASFSYYSGGPAAYQTLYQYDNLGRLKIADNNITALNPYDISNINYDLNGNITSITKGVTTYNYNYYGGQTVYRMQPVLGLLSFMTLTVI